MSSLSLSLTELQRAADVNVVAAFAACIPHVRAPDGGQRRFGRVEAVMSGVDAAFFNPVFVLDPRARVSDVEAGVTWVRGQGHEPAVQVRGDIAPRLDTAIRRLGMAPEAWVTPAMALHPIPSEVPAPPPELRIAFVATGDETRFEEWHVAAGSGPLLRRILPQSILDDPDFILVTGYDDDGPVSSSVAIRSGDVVGIYAVGTIERARRRGYGTATTWAAIDAGRRRWNGRIAVLQSSEMGLQVYRAMGFVEVGRYVEYNLAPPPDPAPAADAQASRHTARR